MAYCLTKAGLALVQRQPWLVHRSVPGPDWHLCRGSGGPFLRSFVLCGPGSSLLCTPAL